MTGGGKRKRKSFETDRTLEKQLADQNRENLQPDQHPRRIPVTEGQDLGVSPCVSEASEILNPDEFVMDPWEIATLEFMPQSMPIDTFRGELPRTNGVIDDDESTGPSHASIPHESFRLV